MSNVEEALLAMRSVALSYGHSVALADASFTIASGEVVALVGNSGSGKTSMLYCLAGLMVPDSGSVRFEGRPVQRLGTAARTRLRREYFGFVFQFADLVPELTLRENISLPLELNRQRSRERRARVNELIGRLD
nr:ATP-binding cassette domain-containing protein [Micromonospora sp. DSM 115978]